MEYPNALMNILTNLVSSLIGIVFLIVIAIFIFDITQRKNTILRNYPVIGHFRYIFNHLGEFFRQYFFAMDREEMPFNRADREWINRASKNKTSTIAFGSTQNLNMEGTPIFTNSMFPMLDKDATPNTDVIIGETYCLHPYTTSSIIHISGMSFGAISKPAVLALAGGAKLANCWLNTGEGGLSKYHLSSGCDIVFQIGTAKYGVRNADGVLCDEKLKEIADNPQIKMFEIKLSQGAKPGKGGILPAIKVTERIAKMRGIPAGKASISPNRHDDIHNTQDLIHIINRIRKATNKPVGIKFVLGEVGWLDEFFGAINAKGIEYAPDFITLDSGDGGTGAAPMALMDSVGLPIKESLPLLIDKLKDYQLKHRVKVIASGKLTNPTKIAWALCAGADFTVSARGFMFAIGCIQSLKCNKNTCPTGITTHNKRLQHGLNPQNKSIKVANYINSINKEVATIAHSCGVKEPRALQRNHVRIVQKSGSSVLMSELYKQ